MDEEKKDRLLARLRYLARRNADDMKADPSLLARLEANLRSPHGHVYVRDRYVCSEEDCWHTYKELLERDKNEPSIRLDCEDGACAVAGALFLQGADVDVGVKIGKHVSHAVCGVRCEGHRVMMDPAVWAGMDPLSEEDYATVRWRSVA
jgi:hypothetical protein